MKFYRYSKIQIIKGESIDIPFTFRGRTDPLDMNGSEWEINFSATPEFSEILLTINSVVNPSKVSLEENGNRCYFALSESDTNLLPRGLVYIRLKAQIPAGGIFRTWFHLTMEVG